MTANPLNLKVGDIIKLGERFKAEIGYNSLDIIILIEGDFEYDNGLYTEYDTAPAIWIEEDCDYTSIYHMFGNNLEYFIDCKIIGRWKNES